MPTSSNPQLAWSARDASPPASMRPIIEWNPDSRGDLDQPAEQGLADALPGVVLVHVHRVLDRRPVGGALLVRRERGEARPPGVASSTATIAANAPLRAASHSCCCSIVRGTMSNVAVERVTSWL